MFHTFKPCGLAVLLICQGYALAQEDGQAAEARAVRFLSREVPAWPVENKCFSCHNNGDGARALYRAARQGHPVPPEALAATDAWLAQPAKWEQDVGDAEFKDARLARIQFAAALNEAVLAARLNKKASGLREKEAALQQAAALLAKDQAADGSWPLLTGGLVAAPATYGPTLATHLARRVLASADSTRYQDALARSQQWLEQARTENVLDAAAVLWSLAEVETAAARQQRGRALDLLRRAQGADGGWGPYPTSPAEPFDTAMALIALAKAGDGSSKPLIARGRAYLIARQQSDGSWPATTRPPGVDSYAQYLSTTGWALQALLETGAGAAKAQGDR